MHPVLFELAGVTITAYGLALGLAFAVGIAFAMRRAKRAGLDPDVILEAGIVALFTSLLGSRLLYAIEYPDAFGAGASWLDALRPFPPGGVQGLSMSLGLLLAVAAVLGWLRLRGAPVLRAADAMAPAVALGEAITRIGCFLNGCCHGVACSLPWGVRFPDGSFAQRALGEVAVHPTQLYTAAACVGLAGLLLWLAPRSRRPGLVFFAYLSGWAALRLVVDVFRYYPPELVAIRISGVAVTKHQLLVGIVLGCGICGLAWRVRRNSAPREAQSVS